MLSLGSPDSSRMEVSAAFPSNYGWGSVIVSGGIELMGLAELLELIESLGHRLPLASGGLHVLDQGIELDLVVDQGNLPDGVLLLDGKEIELLGLCVIGELLLGGFLLSR